MSKEGAHKSKGPFGKEDTWVRRIENVRQRHVVNQQVRDAIREANTEDEADLDLVVPLFPHTEGWLTW